MLAALHVPMFGFTCLAFLMVSVVLAVAVLLVFKSGEKGSTKLGGFAGCMIGLGLVGVAGIMALGTAAVMVTNAWNEAVRRGPVKSFEFRFEDGSKMHGSESERAKREPAEPEDLFEAEDHAAGQAATGGMDAPQPGRGRIEIVVLVRDESAAKQVTDWVREHLETDLQSEWDTVTNDEGTFTRLTFHSDVDSAELESLRANLKRDFPGFELPSGGKIELREPTH